MSIPGWIAILILSFAFVGAFIVCCPDIILKGRRRKKK